MRLVATSVNEVIDSLKEDLQRQESRKSYLRRQTGPGVRQRESDLQYVQGRMRCLEEVIEVLESIPEVHPNG